MILWLNGPFGVGKSTAARGLVARRARMRLVDTELIGAFLVPILGAADDFQDHPSWRRLVVQALAELDPAVPGGLVVPQTVVDRAVWEELRAGLADRGVRLRPVVLDVERTEHARRIDGDAVEAGARAWRHRRRADYDAALPWLRQDADVVDTTGLDPVALVDELDRRIR